MLKALIIEDEVPAQLNLIRAINANFDDIVIVGRLDSVEESVKWLNDPENKADIIFMDVELSDGKCFEIFKRTNFVSNVVITTAYDQYAIQAFKAGSIDYLLKPIDFDELKEAVLRCRNRVATQFNSVNLENASAGESKKYKKRFAVKIGDKILIINIDDVAYFYSEDKSTYLVTHSNQKYVIDMSLDMLGGMLDPNQFFRLSRAYIGSINSIKSISKHFSSRLKVNLVPQNQHDIYVSRVKIPDFMRWIEGDANIPIV